MAGKDTAELLACHVEHTPLPIHLRLLNLSQQFPPIHFCLVYQKAYLYFCSRLPCPVSQPMYVKRELSKSNDKMIDV